MMRKNNNNQNRNNNMKHRGGQGGGGGGRRYSNNGGGGGGGNRGGNDSGNIQRQKHHATQMREKFSNMARDAQNNGDRVDVEYFLQHVDHYTRVLTDIAAIEAERHQHQREHFNQVTDNQGGENQNAPQQGNNDAAQGGDTQQAAPQQPPEGGEEFQRQPRPSRQPRRQYNAPDNGAAEANSNTTDIPLPGSILPPV